MAERLTELDCYDDYQILEEDLPKAIDKLGGLKDILEKYGFKGVEELEKELSMNKLLHETTAELSKMVTKAEKDRNTWKRACELALKEDYPNRNIPKEDWDEHLKLKLNYFYQQAKEGKK